MLKPNFNFPNLARFHKTLSRVSQLRQYLEAFLSSHATPLPKLFKRFPTISRESRVLYPSLLSHSAHIFSLHFPALHSHHDGLPAPLTSRASSGLRAFLQQLLWSGLLPALLPHYPSAFLGHTGSHTQEARRVGIRSLGCLPISVCLLKVRRPG